MIRYVGNGEWIPGVPARDLSDDEYECYKNLISGSSLYHKEKDKRSSAISEKSDKEE